MTPTSQMVGCHLRVKWLDVTYESNGWMTPTSQMVG